MLVICMAFNMKKIPHDPLLKIAQNAWQEHVEFHGQTIRPLWNNINKRRNNNSNERRR